MDIIIEFLQWLQPYEQHSYAVMFGVLLLCGFGFPMPEDVVLVTGGILAASGVTDLWWTQGVCFMGVILGDGVVFSVGRIMGARVRQTWLFRLVLSPKRDVKVQKVFEKYGDKVVFVARFMPGLRMPIFTMAGVYRVSPVKFFGLDGLAALISVPVWIYLGYIFGENLELLHQKMRSIQGVIFVLLLLVGLGIWLWFRKRREATE
jgi:membrane protein DedA with SNARE-associated domain